MLFRRLQTVTRALAFAVLAFGVLLAAPHDRVAAHATLAASDPADDAVVPLPPARVTLTFTEPVDTRLSSIEVTTTEGRRVDRDDLTVQEGGRRAAVSLAPLERGTYIVDWTNVSTVDGHPLSGRFAFHVGERSSDALISQGPPTFPSPLEPPARFLLDGGLLILAGTLSVIAAVVRPPRGEAAAWEQPLSRLALAAAAMALAGAALQLAAQTSATGAAPLDVLSGRWGTAYVTRVVDVGLAVALILMRRPRLALIPVAVALGSLVATSHGMAVRGLAVPAVVAGTLHLAAAAVWVGGFPGMLLLVWKHRGDRAELTAALRRFSTLALIATGVAGLTGAYLAWLHVLRLSALDTTYGRAVLTKTAFFIGLIVLGAMNRRWAIPALARGARRRIRMTLGIEVALGVGLVAAVAVMTSTFPAREALRPPLPGGVTTALGGTSIEVGARPGLPGANELTVTVHDARGRTIDGAAVALRAAPSGQEPDVSVPATGSGGGVYQAPVVLGARGIWVVFVSVAPREGFDTNGSVRMEIGGAPPPRPAPSIDWGWKALGWMLVIGGVFAAAAADRTWAWGGRRRAPWYGASAALAGLVVLVLVAPRMGEPTTLPATSPETLVLGERVYLANCVGCHGVGLVPIEGVADLRMHALMHSDTSLLTLVRNGRPGSIMPAFRDTLSEKEIGAVLVYIQEQVGRLEAASTPSPLPTPAR